MKIVSKESKESKDSKKLEFEPKTQILEVRHLTNSLLSLPRITFLTSYFPYLHKWVSLTISRADVQTRPFNLSTLNF